MVAKRHWLYEIRKDRKLNHQQVAKGAGIERAYYTMIESGNRNPSVEVAKAIASVMGFDWTQFYEDKKTETA